MVWADNDGPIWQVLNNLLELFCISLFWLLFAVFAVFAVVFVVLLNKPREDTTLRFFRTAMAMATVTTTVFKQVVMRKELKGRWCSNVGNEWVCKWSCLGMGVLGGTTKDRLGGEKEGHVVDWLNSVWMYQLGL